MKAQDVINPSAHITNTMAEHAKFATSQSFAPLAQAAIDAAKTGWADNLVSPSLWSAIEMLPKTVIPDSLFAISPVERMVSEQMAALDFPKELILAGLPTNFWQALGASTAIEDLVKSLPPVNLAQASVEQALAFLGGDKVSEDAINELSGLSPARSHLGQDDRVVSESSRPETEQLIKATRALKDYPLWKHFYLGIRTQYNKLSRKQLRTAQITATTLVFLYVLIVAAAITAGHDWVDLMIDDIGVTPKDLAEGAATLAFAGGEYAIRRHPTNKNRHPINKLISQKAPED